MIKRLRWLQISILLIVFLWFGGLAAFGHTVMNYTLDYSQPTDAVIVLTGGKNRIAEGIKLYNTHLSNKLFISGVPSSISIAEIEQEAAIKAFNTDNIIIGRKATNTIENASEIIEWIDEYNLQSIRLVTSNYHLPRSMEELLFYDKNIRIVKHPVYSPNISDKWWNKWGTFKLIVTEYNKFLFVYICRHLQKIKGEN